MNVTVTVLFLTLYEPAHVLYCFEIVVNGCVSVLCGNCAFRFLL